MLVLEEPLPVRAPQVRQVIEAGKQPGQVPGHGNTAVLVPLGALDHHHRVAGVDVAAPQAAGFGGEKGAGAPSGGGGGGVGGGGGGGGGEEGAQLVIGKRGRRPAGRAGDPRG